MSQRDRIHRRDLRIGMAILALAVVAVLGSHVRGMSAPPSSPPRVTEGRMVRLDPRFDRLVPEGTALERIATGLSRAEGPVWDRSRSSLLFSDTPRNAVLEWRDGVGVRPAVQPSGYTGSAPFGGREPGSNGLAFDRDGRLLLCEHGDRLIARIEPDGRKTTLVDRYQGRRLNSPNDLVVSSAGAVYFTDPPLGLPKGPADPGREIPWSGVYRRGPDGDVSLVVGDLIAPDGIALSPTETTLYVSNADRGRAVWMAYELDGGGRPIGARVLFDATAAARAKRGLPGGMKVDRDGNLFAAGPGGVLVLAPDGTHLGTMALDVPVSNVAWGGDGSTLYVTAATAVYRVALATKGVGF